MDMVGLERPSVRVWVESAEVAAQTAAQRELERIAAEDAAADQHRRELPMADTRPTDWDPQC